MCVSDVLFFFFFFNLLIHLGVNLCFAAVFHPVIQTELLVDFLWWLYVRLISSPPLEKRSR